MPGIAQAMNDRQPGFNSIPILSGSIDKMSLLFTMRSRVKKSISPPPYKFQIKLCSHGNRFGSEINIEAKILDPNNQPHGNPLAKYTHHRERPARSTNGGTLM